MGVSRIPFFLVLTPPLLVPLRAEDAPLRVRDLGTTLTVTAEAEPVALQKTPNPVLVVGKSELDRRGAGHVGELLQSLFPGQALASGGPGTSTSFFLGGARSQDVALLIDGIRFHDPMGLGGVPWSTLSMTGIDRVEVQQGGATRQGINAMGGVVALSSAQGAPQGWSGSVRLGAGSRSIRRATLEPAYGWGTGWVRLGAHAEREAQSIPAERPYRAVSSSLSLGQQLGERHLLTASYRNAYTGTPIPFDSIGYATTPRLPAEFKARRETLSRNQIFSANVFSAYSETLSSEVILGGWEQERMNPKAFDPIGLPVTRYASRGRQAQGRLSWTPRPAFGLTASVDASTEWGTSPEYAALTEIVHEGRGRHVVYGLEGFWEPVPRLRFTAALRHQRDRLEVQQGGGGVSDERTSRATTARAGLNLTLPGGFRWFVSGGTHRSHPLLYQVLFNLGNEGPRLDNEKGFTVQTGTTWERGPWKGRLVLSRTWFDRLVAYDPALGRVVVSPWGTYATGAYTNNSRVRIQSAEFGLGYRTAAWGLEGFYRNQDARDLEAPRDQRYKTNAVIRRPFQSVGLSGFAVFGDWRLEGRWSWFGPRYEYGLPSAYRAHFNDLSLSMAWSPRPDLTFTLKGDHLLQPTLTKKEWLSRRYDFDHDLSMVYGFPAQPPTISLDVAYRF